MELGYLLGSVRYTTLGAYGRHDFPDPRVDAPLRACRARLADLAGATLPGGIEIYLSFLDITSDHVEEGVSSPMIRCVGLDV